MTGRFAWSFFNFALPLLLFVAFWQALSAFIPPNVLPSFLQVLGALVEIFTDAGRSLFVAENFLNSLRRIYLGLLVGAVLGALLGVAMARSSLVEDILAPVLAAFYPLPKPALLPLAIMWLGLGDPAIVAVVILGTMLPMVVNTFNGVRAVQTNLIWSAYSLGVSRPVLATKVLFPAALPQMMVGLRIAHNMAVVTVVAAELVVSQSGIGFLIGNFGNAGAYDYMFAAVALVVLVVAALDRCVIIGTDRLLHWHRYTEA